ncbi:MAG: DUF3240 domain-containing protein [Methylococcaceae bacterium]|nr:DUF3240 domain-containing protein [Methylococcaceae bacterium]
MTDQYLLTLTIAPAIEENLVDWLLENQGQIGFSSFPVNGHSSHPEDLSLAEQVAGRQKQVRFQIHLDTERVSTLLSQLRRDFAGAGLHYWVSPVLDSGRI